MNDQTVQIHYWEDSEGLLYVRFSHRLMLQELETIEDEEVEPMSPFLQGWLASILVVSVFFVGAIVLFGGVR